MMTETDLLDYLNTNGFVYRLLVHPAVFTCEEAEGHHAGVDAVHTKNLFLCDKKARRFFLVVTACEKTVDLGELAGKFESSHLRFASEENLMRFLGVSRGSVTMMGLVNDTEHRVELWVDETIWAEEHFLSHPLVNTATLVLEKTGLLRFFELTGHAPKLF